MRKKRRSFQQVMEEKSLPIIRRVIPEEWVIHDYKPDFGIDLVVEVFKPLNSNKQLMETLGELFFVQAKSIQKTKIEKVRVFDRYNVEKRRLSYNKNSFFDIDVIKFKIETSELATIQSMGTGLPVILFLVSLDLNRVFFVCLNDLIDKVIIPQDPTYHKKKFITILIPAKNEVDTIVGKTSLRFYAKRIKFYSAFQKFSYQRN